MIPRSVLPLYKYYIMSFTLSSKNGVNDTIALKDTIPKENWSDACHFIRNCTSLKRIEFHKIDIGGDYRTTCSYLSAIFSSSGPALDTIEIELPRKELLLRRQFGIIIDFMRTHH